jgi:hypothetical protein
VVRTGNLGSPTYAPGTVPSDPAALPTFLTLELAKIKAALDLAALGHVDTTYVAPAKPREGDVRLADGTAWNPGSGAGVYAYYGGAWAKLG